MNSVTLKIIMVINDPVSDHELFGKKRIALLMLLANLILTGVVFGLLSITPVTPPRSNKMQGRYLIAGGRSDEGQIEMTEVVELILWRITIYTIWSCWINFWKSWGVQLVMESRTRNPRGMTSTFKSPTRTRPQKLIPEQNPKPDIQTPKPRKPPKVLNLHIKYLQNTIKINKKKF